MQTQRRLGSDFTAALLPLALAAVACSHSTSPQQPAAKSAALISGWVTSAGGGHASVPSRSPGGPSRSALTTLDACASGTYVGALVGGGGASITSSAYTAGSFTIPGGLIPVGKELMVTFNCSDGSRQRCLAKPGDSGISCDPVADGVLAAFEAALSKTVFNPALDGKPVSKIASAIVQAAQTDTTAAGAFNAQIVACKSAVDVGSCDKDAIHSSPFAGAFQMMETMVNGWSVEALYTLMVDVFDLQVSIDSFLYSDFGTNMDKWLSTDFIVQSRAFIAGVVADQLAGGNKYIIKVQCQMWYNKKGSGGQFMYDPTMQVNTAGISFPSCVNDAAFAKDGLTPTQISLLDAAIVQQQSGGGGGGGGQLDLSASLAGCNVSMDWSALPSDYFCVGTPSLQFASKFTESNRNDPEGSHGSDFYNQAGVSMINAFKELQQSLQAPPPGAPTGCMTASQNGPPIVNVADPACDAWFQTNIMVPNAKNFSGVLGLYLKLKSAEANPAGGSALLSLKEIHQLFVQDDYLASRLTAQGNSVSGVQITDAPPNSNNWLPALLQVASSGQLELPDLFVWTPAKSISGLTATTAQATAILAASPVPYTLDFKMFESIPSATDIRNDIYRSAYHSDWNPTGSKLFYAASVQNTNVPIFCKMQDAITGKATERPLDLHVQLSCLDSTQIAGLTAPAANGSMVMPDGYPYTLQSFGFQGDGKGSVFALADRRTGFTVQAANAPIMLYQISSGNALGECDNLSLANTVVAAKLNFGWGGATQNQAVSVYCLDTTNLAQAGQVNLYYGGNLSISQTDFNGVTNQWQTPEVGVLDPATGTNTLVPACLFASATTFTTSADGKTTSGLATIDTSGMISVLGDAVVDVCTAVQHTTLTTRYNIVMGSSLQTSDRTLLKAHLIGDQRQGYRMLQWQTCADVQCTTNTNVDWNAMNVSISPGVMEASLGAGKTVAPGAASAYVMSVRLLNQKWQAKFDPYCDDVDGAGYCKCFIAGTTTPRADPLSCSLEDDSAYPTMSSPPYPTQGPQAAGYQAMFTQLGGKSGAQLATIVNSTGQTVAFDGNYIQANQLWMDWNQAFKCYYKATGETADRTPAQFDNMHPYSLHHGGCPDVSGAIVPTSSCGVSGCALGGGPVRLVNPRPMNNAYAINRPNMLIKMVNYATKSTGQGVTVDPTVATFSFDEALALVALRYAMPRLGSKVYLSDGVTEVPGALPFFSPVRLSQGGNDMDLPSAVLRAMLHGSTELTAP